MRDERVGHAVQGPRQPEREGREQVEGRAVEDGVDVCHPLDEPRHVHALAAVAVVAVVVAVVAAAVAAQTAVAVEVD